MLCGAEFHPCLFCFTVRLIEPSFFRDQLFAFRFQLFQAGQFGDLLGLEIGGCRLVSCQFSVVLFPKDFRVLCGLDLLGKLPVLEIGCYMAAQFPVGFDAVLQVFDHLETLVSFFLKFSYTGIQFFLAVQVVSGE